MSKFRRVVSILLFLSIFLGSCTYDNLEDLILADECRQDSLSFNLDILPIFNLYCNNNICHGGTFPQGRVSLTNYEGVVKVVNDSRLLGSIKHLPGFNPMPVDTSKLSSCEILLIKTWIESGALNN